MNKRLIKIKEMIESNEVAFAEYKKQAAWLEASRAFDEKDDVFGLLGFGLAGLIVSTWISSYLMHETAFDGIFTSLMFILVCTFSAAGIYSGLTKQRREARARRRWRYYEELCYQLGVDP